MYYKQQVFKVSELDKKYWRDFFLWCSKNNIKLELDYTEFIKFNNLQGYSMSFEYKTLVTAYYIAWTRKNIPF